MVNSNNTILVMVLTSNNTIYYYTGKHACKEVEDAEDEDKGEELEEHCVPSVVI